jgi:phage I-like protein
MKNFLRELEGRTLTLREIVPAANGSSVTLAPKEFRLLPLGESRTRDGRVVVLDAAGAAAAVAAFAAGGTDLPIDYEHQTQGLVEFTDPETGKPERLDYRSPDGTAPAAGWFKLEARPDGLWAAGITWTERALAMLGSREYRYFSPVIHWPNGRVVGIKSVALTNRPALTNIDPLVASDTAAGSTALGMAEAKKEEVLMDLKKLLEALGLPETGTEEDCLAAIAKLAGGGGAEAALTELKSRAEPEMALAANVRGVLKLAPAAPESEVVAAVVALSARPDASVAADLAALKDQLATRTATEVVDAAMKAGKIPPALKDWALTEAKERPTQFAAFVEKAVPVVPLDGIDTVSLSDRANSGASAGDPPDEMLRRCGMDRETYRKHAPRG